MRADTHARTAGAGGRCLAVTPLDEQTAARPARGIVLLAAILTLANLVALHLEVLAVQTYYVEPTDYIATQEIWGPIVLATWAQAVVNGAGLVAWKRTRKVGTGMLLGALCAALVVGALMIVVVATLPYP
jgi:hypothetical protein